MRYITILGSTGSIGSSTLEVIKKNLNKFSVRALIANNNVSLMTKQCITFNPDYACMINESAAEILKINLESTKSSTVVLSGIKNACELSSLDNVDIVMAAISGISCLLPIVSALRSGKQVLLANKESLIACGKLFINEVHKNRAILIPVDSEHNAIFQNLPESIQKNLGYSSLKEHGVSKIILTGSGGPFRKVSLDKLSNVTPSQACIHPNWSMGNKISVDSATMMNKGLEYIEAKWLFNASEDQIEILLHPESVIHSMVYYIDGTILAQLGSPDMRIPISYSLSYPNRINSGATQLDFTSIKKISFEKPDFNRYPCLELAIYASRCGQAATTVLNASNEIAVSAFLQGDILFTDIALVNRRVLERANYSNPSNIEEVIYIDNQTRLLTSKVIDIYKKN